MTAGLEDLPAKVLDRLVFFLSTDKDHSQEVGSRIRRPHGFSPNADLIAFSSTSKSLRKGIAPYLFQTLSLVAKDGFSTLVEVKRLEWLAQKGRGLLEYVRLGDVPRAGIDVACECIKGMINLENLTHCAFTPVSPRFVQALSTLQHFEAFHSWFAGVESLPHLLPLANKLASLILTANIRPPSHLDVWDLCPITVAANRRNQLPHDDRNVPTVREQAEALVNSLAKLLFATKDKLKIFGINAQGIYHTRTGETTDTYALAWLSHLFQSLRDLNGGEYPVFPQLEGVRVAYCDAKCVGMTHLLKTSPKIRDLEIAERPGAQLPVVKAPLQKLEWLYILADDLVPVAPFVRRVTDGSLLRWLTLSGVQQRDIGSIFERDLPNLRELRLICYGTTPFELRYFQRIVKGCPRLVSFDLTGQFYDCEAPQIFAALRPLARLRHFAFDHPWEKPRNFPFPSPDGRTIRTSRNQDFRIIGVVRGSINAEIKKRIGQDIQAVTPVYHKRFASIAKKHPSLRTISWTATDEVTWDWTFIRDGDLDPGKLKKLQHHPEIDIDVGGPGDLNPGAAGIFLTMRAGEAGHG
ncbi:hypothetical protein JCM11251_000160 [Rhodosporidiobolus azoricus]